MTKPPKVIFACPTVSRPYAPFLAAMEAAVPALDAAGIDHQMVFEVGNAYISFARANMLRKAMDAKADIVVFLDHDVSFDPDNLVQLIQTPGDVVAGLYRFKKADEEYMGAWETTPDLRPMVRDDGCIAATRVPAGFLKVTKEAVHRFMVAYPELCYGHRYELCVDLFNHGAHEGVWWGEDYAFSRRWIDCGGEIWVVPDLNLVHHTADEAFAGNLHEFMLRQPGGSNDPARLHAVA